MWVSRHKGGVVVNKKIGFGRAIKQGGGDDEQQDGRPKAREPGFGRFGDGSHFFQCVHGGYIYQPVAFSQEVFLTSELLGKESPLFISQSGISQRMPAW